ncbi:hypothetical protein [Pseudoalteromonas piscicida]|uniref:Uncharacterized protein n=1 Tax=Pseudoalteromonas piscicida TaxID=43662 RepID=A0A2A5JK21_PSEO7|nr:hypothetical protein [Pseudoalteromonas piscicida]PCK29757.1 hypothetical protein CEX98_21090 [Pseudoalteromonas piscicida]
MAIFYNNFKNSSPLELDTFIKIITDAYLKDNSLAEKTLRTMAETLHRLSLNKYFLTRSISNRILREEGIERDFFSGHDSYVVHVNHDPFFQIRLCFWHPSNAKNLTQNPVYSSLHDHNFPFLTTNYFGPGYCSQFYQYDYNDSLSPGQLCNLRPTHLHQLTKGEVVFYEPSLDAHLQIPPHAFSVSLNLMFEVNHNKQFIFNKETGAVKNVVSRGADIANELLRKIHYA